MSWITTSRDSQRKDTEKRKEKLEGSKTILSKDIHLFGVLMMVDLLSSTAVQNLPQVFN